MITKRLDIYILIRLLSIFATLVAAAYLIVQKEYLFFSLLIPVIIYQGVNLYKQQLKIHKELALYIESIGYKDLSRNFDEKNASPIVRPLRKGFNQINKTLKGIAREKETQYQYLQKILEMVDTGILSYQEATGEVVWMNEALKTMLQMPYIKNVETISKKQEKLYGQLKSIKPGESKIFDMEVESSAFKILITATAFQTEGKKFKLIAFQNVSEALDDTESKAWQRLLSVLTHEIMNSIAPIYSLADTLKERIKDLEKKGDQDCVEDLSMGIDTIKRRSEGLLKFADTYRNLNKISKLTLQPILVKDLLENLQTLMQPTCIEKNIDLRIVLKDSSMSLNIDINLIEQVLINLITNAIDGIKDVGEPAIVLASELNKKGKVSIKIIDNGPGIPEEVLDKIFIPFFTTKKNGSGIGLTLCKQIMRLHKGNIQVFSKQNQGTVFILEF